MRVIAKFILTALALPVALFMIMCELCIWAYDDSMDLDISRKTINNLSFGWFCED